MGRIYITRRDSLISLIINCAKGSPRSSLLAPKPAIQILDADRKRTILITDKCTKSFTILSALQGAQDVHSAMPSLCHTSGERSPFCRAPYRPLEAGRVRLVRLRRARRSQPWASAERVTNSSRKACQAVGPAHTSSSCYQCVSAELTGLRNRTRALTTSGRSASTPTPMRTASTTGGPYVLFGSTRSRPERSQRVNLISLIPTTRLGSEKRSASHLPWLTYTTVFWGAEEHATMAELVWHLSTVGPARTGGLAPHPDNPHKLRCELVPEDEDGLGAQACRRSRYAAMPSLRRTSGMAHRGCCSPSAIARRKNAASLPPRTSNDTYADGPPARCAAYNTIDGHRRKNYTRERP